MTRNYSVVGSNVPLGKPSDTYKTAIPDEAIWPREPVQFTLRAYSAGAGIWEPLPDILVPSGRWILEWHAAPNALDLAIEGGLRIAWQYQWSGSPLNENRAWRDAQIFEGWWGRTIIGGPVKPFVMPGSLASIRAVSGAARVIMNYTLFPDDGRAYVLTPQRVFQYTSTIAGAGSANVVIPAPDTTLWTPDRIKITGDWTGMPAGSLLRASINHWIGVSTWHEWIPQNLGVPMILDWPCDMCELIAPFTLANPNVGAWGPIMTCLEKGDR